MVRGMRLHPFSRRLTAGLLSVALATGAVVTSSVPAFAQSDEDKAAARQFATDGAKAMDQKRWTDAIDLFTRAESLVHSPQHLVFLARAHVAIGRLVKAREYYLKVVKEDIPAGKPKAWTDAKTAAQAEITPLEPKIPQLKIVVEGGDAKNAEVKLDGEVVKSALIGLPRPVDPGEHTLEAKDGNGATAKQTINLAEGANETVTLKLEAGKGGTGDKKDPPPPDPKDQPPPEKKDPPPDAGEGPSRVLPFTLIGVGVVGLAVGTVFLLKWQGTRSDADALCPNGTCPVGDLPKVNELDDQWKGYRTLSFIGYGVGIVSAGVGLTLLLTAKSAPPPATGAWVRPWVGVNSVGVFGAF